MNEFLSEINLCWFFMLLENLSLIFRNLKNFRTGMKIPVPVPYALSFNFVNTGRYRHAESVNFPHDDRKKVFWVSLISFR